MFNLFSCTCVISCPTNWWSVSCVHTWRLGGWVGVRVCRCQCKHVPLAAMFLHLTAGSVYYTLRLVAGGVHTCLY